MQKVQKTIEKDMRRIVCNGCLNCKVRRENGEYKANCAMGYELLVVDVTKNMRYWITQSDCADVNINIRIKALPF